MKGKKLWQGRFEQNSAQILNEFNSSLGFDIRLYQEDIEGSLAHVKMLAKQKIISDSDTGEILGAHIIGAEATEMIGEIGMLKYLEGTNEELHRLTHAHPTLSEVIKEAAASTNNEAIHF